MKLMVLAALAALQAAPAAAPSAAQWRAAREALDRALLDYPSARFRDVRADGARVCGMVNTKNRMGAYGGFSRFVVFFRDGKGPSVYLVGEGNGDMMVEALCGGQQLPATDHTAMIQPG